MGAIYQVLFGWIPNAGMQVIILGLFSIVIIFIVFRIIKIVLDAIPFL